eukprot:PITA_04768
MIHSWFLPSEHPVKQRPYHLNLKYKDKVCLELDKMLTADIIESVEESDWKQHSHGCSWGHHERTLRRESKILRTGLWWPTLHQYSKAYCNACDVCQRTGRPSQRDEMPLNPQMTLQPFEKWAIDFLRPIQPQGKTGVRYIITAMGYLTRWAEAHPVKD